MTDVQQIPFSTIDGGQSSLGDLAGSVVLVVNVASKCGLTPQYEALEKLYEEKKDAGLTIVGFPANNFRGQEPGTDEEIAEFCSVNYNVQFPLAAKISVVGEDQHPLYRALIQAIPHAEGDPEAHRDRLRSYQIEANEDPDILWNFEKFLIDREGNVVRRFAPQVTPDDPMIVGAIDDALAG